MEVSVPRIERFLKALDDILLDGDAAYIIGGELRNEIGAALCLCEGQVTLYWEVLYQAKVIRVVRIQFMTSEPVSQAGACRLGGFRTHSRILDRVLG